MDGTVWYASYGSNMWWSRFRCYLEGGVPPGSSRHHRGARDPSPPRHDAAIRLPRRVMFAGDVVSWGGGGVAFLDHDHAEGDVRAWGRLWLVTVEQLADVVAQENGGSAGDVDFVRDLGAAPADLVPGIVTPMTRTAENPGRYTGILALEPLDGIPVMTCTSPTPLAPEVLNPPSIAYRDTLARGLVECTDMTPDGIDAYLSSLVP